MVELGCCASMHVGILFAVNIILFIVGIVQIGISAFFLVAGTDDLGFVSDVYQGDDTAVNSTLAMGVLFVIISFWACYGAKIHSKCMLWVYAIILFFIIMGQAMTVAALGVSIDHGESIFADLWKELEPETIDKIEETYKCCSFNGNSSDTWAEDARRYQSCTSTNSYSESCWQMFESEIDENYDMVRMVTAIFLGFQILIYFSTHYVIQSIAEAEGVEEMAERTADYEMKGKPIV